MIDKFEEQTHKKNFLMMVNPASLNTQSLSKVYGFTPPSEDVLEAEAMDVAAGWLSLAATGTLHYVRNASTWLAEYVCKLYDLDSDNIDPMSVAYYSFGASLLSYLEGVGSIEIIPHGELKNNMEHLSEYLPPAFMVIPFTEEDFDD